jgi:hypothetical protein
VIRQMSYHPERHPQELSAISHNRIGSRGSAERDMLDTVENQR